MGVFCLAGLLSPCLTPQFGHVGLCTGPRSLLTPQCGTYRTLHNSFNGTNTVLRPGESREGEGRKKRTSKFRVLNEIEMK